MRKYEIGGSTDFFNKLADDAMSQFEDQLSVDSQVGAENEPTEDTDNQQDVLYGEADISPDQDYDQLLSDYNDLQAKYDNLNTGSSYTPPDSFDDGFMNYLFQDRNKLPIDFSGPDEEPESTGGVMGTINSVIDTVKKAVGNIDITSQFRTPEHNRAVGGAKNSFHLTGQAVDLAPTEKLNKYLTSSEGRQELADQGYEIIDERNRKGHGAHWHLEPAKRQLGGYGQDDPGPKKKPIITDDPNDPRVKKYQDSLLLYNMSENSKSILKTKINPLLANNKLNEASDLWDAFMLKDDSISGPAFERLNYPKTVATTISPFNSNFRVNEFKKPVQPVIYQQQIELTRRVKGDKPPAPPPHHASFTKGIPTSPSSKYEFSPPQAGGQSNIAGRPQNPTDYSYSYRDEQGQQQTVYFPNWDIWNQFVQNQPFIDAPTNAAKTFGHATGHYLKR